ncbi:MAG: Gfo/Idh/MocA family oxidoreductase [Anaerolineae bacterium]
MKVRWGVLGTAKIALENVIPAMQAGEYCQIEAIASRDMARAKEAARWLGIPRAYGSYEALLDDGEIDAVYIPLPNHLHVPWSLNALEAGKHVLCEKPIGLSAAEAQQLLIASEDRPQLKAMEAFMYRFHPQWRRAHQIVTEGGVGELQAIQSFFAYHNVDPDNIRNQPDIGGGALMDIGCYCVSLSRWLFGAEPERVLGMIEYDPEFGTDRLTSGLLDFGRGRATFTCATQLSEYQRVNVVGDEGRVEIEIPFNAPPDRSCRIWHHRGEEVEEIAFEAVNQYTLQGDRFSQAILEDGEVPTPLEDGVANMSVIEAVVRSAREGGWVW